MSTAKARVVIPGQTGGSIFLNLHQCCFGSCIGSEIFIPVSQLLQIDLDRNADVICGCINFFYPLGLLKIDFYIIFFMRFSRSNKKYWMIRKFINDACISIVITDHIAGIIVF